MDNPRTITVATLSIKNSVDLYPDANGTMRAGGFVGQYLAIVLSALGMDYRIVIPEDGEFGNLKQDGNYSGIIGMVSRKEADIGCALLRISEERSLAVDFSRTFDIDGLAFVGEKPGSIASIFAYLYPFDKTIWIGICVTVIALSVFCHVLGGGWCFWKLLSSVLKQPMELGDGSGSLDHGSEMYNTK